MKNNENTFKFSLSKSEDPLPCVHRHVPATHLSCSSGFSQISSHQRRGELNNFLKSGGNSNPKQSGFKLPENILMLNLVNILNFKRPLSQVFHPSRSHLHFVACCGHSELPDEVWEYLAVKAGAVPRAQTTRPKWGTVSYWWIWKAHWTPIKIWVLFNREQWCKMHIKRQLKTMSL